MQLDHITPLILTFNEEPNLRRCLARLSWAKEVVILDSGSTDATAVIAAEFLNTRLITRPFDDHTAQWNHGLDATLTTWVLSLDCDYVLRAGFEDELAQIPTDTACDAFYATFRYLIFGKALRACLYPPRAILFRKDHCRYVPDGHTQKLSIPGSTVTLTTQVDHDDRKPLTRWLSSQDKYAKLEAEKLTAHTGGSMQDHIRLTLILGPIVVFFYTLIIHRALLDGWHGWYYAFQRTLAEIILSLRLLERRITS